MSKETSWDVVVIGGGPAGMISAGRAGERGRRVLLLEKNFTLGNKLLLTGGGRCNLTNNIPDPRTMLAKYKNSGKFLFSAFAQFGVPETIKFLNDLEVKTKEEEEGRVFPVSNKAETILDALIRYMKKGGVEIRNNSEVVKIEHKKTAQQIVITLADKSKILTQSCVVACGGTAYPETGSTGQAFQWLEKLGHRILESEASLVPVALKDSWIKKLAGLTLSDIKLTTFQKGIKQKKYTGNLLFTHVGISGPMVLNMSREVGALLKKGEVVIMLDLFPGIDSSVLREKLQTILVAESNKKIKNALAKIIPPALVEPILMLANIDDETPNHSLPSAQRKELVSILKAVPLNVLGLLGKDKAIASSGGVELSEVNFKTMQSRLVPQIYLVGDILNIDRPSGGYSLQICWTTGYVAGDNC